MINKIMKKIFKEFRRSRFVFGLPQGRELRLHLGCGDRYVPDWVNVDLSRKSTADLIEDVRKLNSFPSNSVDSIYACHLLEHFSHSEAEQILSNWNRVLKPGGELRISVPDLDKIIQIYKKNWEHFQFPGNSPWIGLVYGGQKDQFDFHKTGFNRNWLTFLLERNGFDNVAEYPHTPHFLGENFYDASLAKEPFGEYFSLNMICRKKERGTFHPSP